MEKADVKLNILIDILYDKIQNLNLILNICINQETILLSQEKNIEILNFFKETAKEKQNSIDKILMLDSSFNSTYDQVSDVFKDRNLSLAYKPSIVKIQNLISQIEDLTEKIKNFEKSNDTLIAKIKPYKKSPTKQSYTRLQNLYNNKKRNMEEFR
ncbi:MAG: hypothetical protein ACK5LY_08075 [Lachnospirales bacterium]